MRLIDADALCLEKFVEPRTERHQGWNDALDAATTQAPTIDAVPVVRCKDCKYRKLTGALPFMPYSCDHAIVDSAELCKTDGKDDQEIVYTKEVIDRKLRAACGEIKPFDERYALENLYFWDNREEWRNKEG